MKKLTKLLITIMLSFLLAFSLTACSREKTFNKACEGLKLEIIANSTYLCEFELDEVYGRPVYSIYIYTFISENSYLDILASITYNSFKREFLPYIEENFANFPDASIFVCVFVNDKGYEGSYGYIYGYYAEDE